MCKKNDYGRRSITALLAVLTALFVLTLMSGDANAAQTKINITANDVSGCKSTSAANRFRFIS